ncbi:MAG: LamG domain-containing protein [Myxococcota bacterium]
MGFVLGCAIDRSGTGPSDQPGGDASLDAPVEDAPLDDRTAPPADALSDRSPDADAAPPPSPCPVLSGIDVLALYSFDEEPDTDRAVDQTGLHPAALRNGSFPERLGPSREECGQAFQFDGQAYLEIADTPDWDLEEGAIDFWFLPPDMSEGRQAAIVSRDANGIRQPGHLTVFYLSNGRIEARLQREANDQRLTSAALPDQWTHVGVSFGPQGFRLFINGVLVASNPVFTFGIDGNANPWTIGASQSQSSEGEANSLFGFPPSGAIDHFRVQRLEDDFRQIRLVD